MIMYKHDKLESQSIRNDVDVHRLYRLENTNSIRVKPILFFLLRFAPYDTYPGYQKILKVY